MLPATRPRPGKCLAVVATLADAMPSMNAAPCAPLLAGSEPNCRSSSPTGAFVLAPPAGTTSITGARSRFTPAARSSPPHPAAAARSADTDHVPWVTADGMTENPGPVSCWTWPPSWLAATKKRAPPVIGCVASDCMCAVAAASAVTPSEVGVSSSDPK